VVRKRRRQTAKSVAIGRPRCDGWDDVADGLFDSGGDVRVGLGGQMKVVAGVGERRMTQIRLSAICSTGVPPSISRVASVPQGMHAVAAFLADRDTGHPSVLEKNLMQMVLVGERPDRGGVPEEHLSAVAGRPTGADVVDDRPADLFRATAATPGGRS